MINTVPKDNKEILVFAALVY